MDLPSDELLVTLAELICGDEVPLVAALRAHPDFLSWLASGRPITNAGLQRWLNRTWVEGEVSARGRHFAVTLSWLDEGGSGDYRLSDPQDEPLLRLDIDRRDGEEMQDGSFCTQIPVTVGRKRARELAKELLAVVEEGLPADAQDGGRLAQRLSWVDERGVKFCPMLDGRKAS